MSRSQLKTFVIRVCALIAYEGLATFGLSAGVGIEPVKGALMAALLPLVVVIRETAKGLIDDGKLSKSEMDSAIDAGKSAKDKK
jgi:hypothetical protein